MGKATVLGCTGIDNHPGDVHRFAAPLRVASDRLSCSSAVSFASLAPACHGHGRRLLARQGLLHYVGGMNNANEPRRRPPSTGTPHVKHCVHVAHHTPGRTRLRLAPEHIFELATRIGESKIPATAYPTYRSVVVGHDLQLGDLLAQLEAYGICEAFDLPDAAEPALASLGWLPLTLIGGSLGIWWLRSQ